MRRLYLLIFIHLSTTISAQQSLFGVYYYLPKAKNSESREFKVREIRLSRHRLDEKYVDINLQPVKEDALPSSYKIDTIIKRDSVFYVVHFTKNGYGYFVFRTSKKGQQRWLHVRANNYNFTYGSRKETMDAIDTDSLPALEMTCFSRDHLLSFLKLKPLEKITVEQFKNVLRNIAAVKKREREIRDALPPELLPHYHVGRFFDISFLYFFVLEGFSPLINGSEFAGLGKQFKSDPGVRELLDVTRK